MRIGLINVNFQGSGGAEKVTFSLINALKKTNHSTTLYTHDSPSICESSNFKIHSTSLIKHKIFEYYKNMKETENLVQMANCENLLIFLGGGFTLYPNNVQYSMIYCNSTFKDELKESKKAIKGITKIIPQKIQKQLKKRLAYLKNPKVSLVSNSHHTRDKMMQTFDKNSIIIYPPVDLLRFSKSFNLPKEKKIITISRYHSEKNLDFAVDVSNQLSLKHKIIGTAKNESELQILNILKSKSTSKNTQFFYNIPDKKIENLLSTAKVYFQPSEETFGIAVVEAIAAGCIPIVPNNSAHLETVPFEILRFNDKEEAIHKIKLALDGKYDYLRIELKKNIENFSEEIFQKKMINEIDKFNNQS